MGYREEMNRWLASSGVDAQTKEEIRKMSDTEAQTRFSSPLVFGTAGLRGIMAPGINAMNIYVVRQATQGMAQLIMKEGPEAMRRGVVIAFDSRINSRLFARESAAVLAANGIMAYIFDDIRPTPELSFAIRHLNTTAGINITASHNPREYNGYKAYWSDGAQLPPEHAKIVLETMRSVDMFEGVRSVTFEQGLSMGLIDIIGREVDEKYLECVLAQRIRPDVFEGINDFEVIYTPFHGAGYKMVPEALYRAGLERVLTVESQMKPDGNFPTVVSPNPENPEGFAPAIELAKGRNVPIIIATDPDCDRMGIMVRNHMGEFERLSGNQVAALLLDYVIKGLIETGRMPEDATAIKTIVSTEMAGAICLKYGVDIRNVLTGFKFIGEQIKDMEENSTGTFIFGFEESYGYLRGTYCRDKDGVVASMLTAEMAVYYAKQGKSLIDAMNALYEEYGDFCDLTSSVTVGGIDPQANMSSKMNNLRLSCPDEIAGMKVTRMRDYLKGTVKDLETGAETGTGLPKSDVLFYELSNASFIIRPSGTEPKIKVYCLCKGETMYEAKQKAEKLSRYASELFA